MREAPRTPGLPVRRHAERTHFAAAVVCSNQVLIAGPVTVPGSHRNETSSTTTRPPRRLVNPLASIAAGSQRRLAVASAERLILARPRSMLASTSVGGAADGGGVPCAAMAQQGTVARWERLLAPRGLYADPGDSRTLRDWFVDTAMFLIAIGIGIAGLSNLWDGRGAGERGLDVAIGIGASLTLWRRRTQPVGVAVVTLLASSIFAMPAGAAVLAIFNAAIRVPRRSLAAIAALAVAAEVTFPLVNPEAGSFLSQLLFALLLTAVALGWGLLVRARRELVGSIRDRAEWVETEQRHRVEQAREAERRRIAHEMHDVLAHRLSLLSVQAGALEFRPDAPDAEVAKAAAVIRTTAATALEELREVIGVLREKPESEARPPQPTLAQLPTLLDESRAARMTIHEEIDSEVVKTLPDALARAAYRVVQEGLTNARKHAPGATVDVRLDGRPGEVVVQVLTRRPVRASAPALAAAGAGVGLIGLAERLAVVGGRLEHGPDDRGDFVLRATLPAND
jgi:signal transduction histidine kinase